MSLSSADWQCAGRLRLGLPMDELRQLGFCDCGEALTEWDVLHLLRCRSGRRTRVVHDVVALEVATIARQSGHAHRVFTRPDLCGTFFQQPPEGSPRQACVPDVTFYRRDMHSESALDITVRGPSRPPLSERFRSGDAAKRGEDEKLRHYRPWMTARGSGHFIPLAVEVYGCLGRMFYDFLRECAAASETGGAASFRPETEYVHRLTHLYMQRISVTLQRTQACAFRYAMARAPARRDPTLRGEEEQTRRMH